MPVPQRFPFCHCSSVRSEPGLLSSLARPLTQSIVTTGRLITFPLGSTAFPASNSRRSLWAILRFLRGPRIWLRHTRQPSDFFRYAKYSVPRRGSGGFDLRSGFHQPIMQKDQSLSPSSDSHGAASSLSLRRWSASSWNLDVSPANTGVHPTHFTREFLAFHSGDHKKVIPSANLRLLQIPSLRA